VLGAQIDRLPMIRWQVNGPTSRMIGGIRPNEQQNNSGSLLLALNRRITGGCLVGGWRPSSSIFLLAVIRDENKMKRPAKISCPFNLGCRNLQLLTLLSDRLIRFPLHIFTLACSFLLRSCHGVSDVTECSILPLLFRPGQGRLRRMELDTSHVSD
jgi:hypothetical protein